MDNTDKEFNLKNFKYQINLLLILTTIALIFVSILELPLLFDGSFYLLITLNDEYPLVPNYRYVHWILGWPALIASWFTSSFPIIRKVFSFAYIMPPLISITLCWLILKERAPHLFIWPVFGICLSTLAGQPSFIIESTIAMQLTWPCLMAFMAGQNFLGTLLTSIIGPILVCTHPVSGVFLSIILFYLILLRHKKGAAHFCLWIAIFLIYISIFTRFLFLNSYERGITNTSFVYLYNKATSGVPVWIIILPWFIGLIISINRKESKNVIPLALLFTHGIFFIYSAFIGRLINCSLDFRHLVVFVSTPYFILPWLDKGNLSLRSRLIFIRGSLIIFICTILVSAFNWHSLVSQLQYELKSHANNCINKDELTFLKDSAIDRWSLTSHSILLLDGKTDRLVLPSCEKDLDSERFNLTDWSRIERKSFLKRFN